MAARDVQITGLGPTPPPDMRIAIDGADISPRAIAGLSLQAEAGDIPRLTLDVVALDVTKLGGKMEIFLPDETRELLVALGWTPPAEGD